MEAAFTRTINVPADRLKPLKTKSDLRGWLQTGFHIGAIVLTSVALSYTWGSWFAVVFFAIQGILINCLYAGVHELSHNTVFKTEALNRFFGRVFGFVLIIGRDQDKFEHFQHHRHTQHLELDAEIIGAKPFTLMTYLLYASGITYWYERVTDFFQLALGSTDQWSYLSEIQLKTVRTEARRMLFLYAVIGLISVLAGTAAPLFLWILPMLTMKWFQLLQNMVEHTGMPHEQDILINTRTVRTNAVMRWLLWNMPYHMAHHSYPMIPFHQLPKLHGEIVEQLGEEPPTISHFGFQKHMIRKLIKEGSSHYSGQDIQTY